MYDKYEESFYYDEPSSVNSDVSGEIVGLGLGLGTGLIATILSGILFLIARFDLLSSSLLALLFYLLTYKQGWDKLVYIIGVIAIIAVSMALQHFVKIFRVIYVLFASIVVSIMGPVFIGYDSPEKMYLIMTVCFVVSAIWGFISWRCIIKK